MDYDRYISAALADEEIAQFFTEKGGGGGRPEKWLRT
jgi:hypothetical protein